MSSPFEAISYLWLWAAFLALFVLFLFVGDRAAPKFDPGEKEAIEAKLRKRPMLALETAGTVKEATDVLAKAEEVDPQARSKFKTALAWDYLFILIYPAWLAVGCMIVSKFLAEHDMPGARLGLLLIILQPLAAVLDATENYSLVRELRGPIESPWPQIAKWCSIPKFAIALGTGLLYVILYGIGSFLWAKAAGR